MSGSQKHTPRRVYLDYAAAAPLQPPVCTAMRPYLEECIGNPNAIHREGQRLRHALTEATEQVARLMQIKPTGVIFTSGGTESNNLAIRGYLQKQRATGTSLAGSTILTTTIEHPATSETLDALVSEYGVQIKYIPLDETGYIDVQQFESLLDPSVILVTVSHINSEVGVIQPTQQLARRLRRFTTTNNISMIPLHVDAAQTPLWYTCLPAALGADLLSLDAGKFGGPVGAGMLLATRADVMPHAILLGGGQQAGVRSGTEPVAQIVGCATAFTWAQAGHEVRAEAVRAVRDAGIKMLQENIPDCYLNGPVGERRVANNINISLPGLDTEYTAIVLDYAGFAVSTKSACSSSDSAASGVVAALTTPERARSTLRITLGPETTESDLQRLTNVLAAHCEKMREIQPLAGPVNGQV